MQLLRLLLTLLFVFSETEALRAQQGGLARADGIYARPHEGGARRWILAGAAKQVLRVTPGEARTVGTAIERHTILTNFGCVDTLGELWCEVQPLHGGPRGFISAVAIKLIEGPDGVVARGVNDSIKRAKKRRFDTIGKVLCAQEQGETLAPCPIGVAQSDGGDTTVVVTFRNGFSRHLFFIHGEFISASATMSGAGRDTDWKFNDGIHYIRADDQQFEIPNELLFAKD